MEKVRLKELTVSEFKALVSTTVKESVEDIIEDFIALNSRNYLRSIKEARKDYREGKVKEFGELFDV
ncbi:MAG: hypothetical protein DRO07_03085 [Candidatus Iainarchaeum archaeon]|uniref:Uncharacterized protein n=1 Tax=Candidatus Iainarchaeum sp. TaxID=3101447 RepID=A0A497JFI8_9ARCH|nr:MAG: hypothetical protein DRO07_03085 [Candidatus Diapherotrites archaeon]